MLPKLFNYSIIHFKYSTLKNRTKQLKFTNANGIYKKTHDLWGKEVYK